MTYGMGHFAEVFIIGFELWTVFCEECSEVC